MKPLLIGLAMGESPRWHDDRRWLSDWGAQEIIAANLTGESEVIVRTTFGLPFCMDWLPDGRLLIVSGREGLLLRREPDGSLAPHADLRLLSAGFWNENSGRRSRKHVHQWRSWHHRASDRRW